MKGDCYLSQKTSSQKNESFATDDGFKKVKEKHREKCKNFYY